MQKTKFMASGPIISWQIEKEKVETVTNFIFLAPKSPQMVTAAMKLKDTWLLAKSLQLCPTLCDPIDGSPPGFPVPRILQARTLEWVAIAFSKTLY